MTRTVPARDVAPMSSGPWLAIDTATDMAGIAVCHAERVVSERTWSSRRHHTRQLAPAVADALVEAGLGVADLEGIAVAIGPGSYTGLRIGLSLAKGLSLGADRHHMALVDLPPQPGESDDRAVPQHLSLIHI